MGPVHFDGRSKACRILHSVFAAKNDKHCPHISFIPLEDANNLTKCQTSKLIDPSKLFNSVR
jgi:hypothetical protein